MARMSRFGIACAIALLGVASAAGCGSDSPSITGAGTTTALRSTPSAPAPARTTVTVVQTAPAPEPTSHSVTSAPTTQVPTTQVRAPRPSTHHPASTVDPGTTAGQQPIRTEQVDTNDGGSYEMTLWGTDVLHADCAQHSYGSITGYFEEHECRSAARYVWTLPFHGRTVAMTVESIVAASGDPNGDIYQWASKLTRLENASDTGSIDDLLRDGAVSLPAGPQHIPQDEAFAVEGQDDVVGVFDAWYMHGSTPSQDDALIALEGSLFPSEAAEPAAPVGAAPATAPACTQTEEGTCIRAGEFCEEREYNTTGQDADGQTLTCTGDQDHPHWEH